jgi:hypothetical protein
MDLNIIKTALGLPDGTDEEILSKINELRAQVGEEFNRENPIITLIRAGQHEAVSETDDGLGMIQSLQFPFKKGNVLFDKLTFRRAKLKDVRRASAKKDQQEQIAEMVSAMTGVALSILDEMDTTDFQVAASVAGFLGQPRPRTGQSS